MNAASIAVLVALALGLAAAIRSIRREKKRGCGGCCGSCGGCGGCRKSE